MSESETEELRRSYFGPRFPKINGFYNANLATWVGLNESEEAEVNKDIEWLKEEIGELPCVDTVFNSGGSSYIDSAVPVMTVYDLIDQLDEPEKPDELQELIEKYSKDSMSTYDVKVEREKFVNDLQSLLIPKQELPVIPKYVAEYLEIAKSGVSLMRVLEIANRRDELPKWEKEYDWISANDETFARAWLDGYEVEKEKLYYIKFSVNKYVKSFDANQLTSFKVFAGRFTEEQIKKVNPKLMAFAMEVAE